MSAADSLGLQFTHRDVEGDEDSPGKHIIDAIGPEGREIGSLTLVKSSRGQNVFPLAEIGVNYIHHGKGVGTALWTEAEQTFPEHRFGHAYMSPGGRRLAERVQARNPERHVLIHDKNIDYKDIEDQYLS